MWKRKGWEGGADGEEQPPPAPHPVRGGGAASGRTFRAVGPQRARPAGQEEPHKHSPDRHRLYSRFVTDAVRDSGNGVWVFEGI